MVQCVKDPVLSRRSLGHWCAPQNPQPAIYAQLGIYVPGLPLVNQRLSTPLGVKTGMAQTGSYAGQ